MWAGAGMETKGVLKTGSVVGKHSALAECMAVQENTLCNGIQTTRQAVGTAGEHFM